MTSTQTSSFRAVDDANMIAFLTKAIVRKERRTTADFYTTTGGKIRLRAQEPRTAKPLTRKQKAERRYETDRHLAALARDEHLMLDVDSLGIYGNRRNPSATRFVERSVTVDYRRGGYIDPSMSTTVTVKCKLRTTKP